MAVESLRYEKEKKLREDINNSLSSKFCHLTSVAMGLVAEVAALDTSVTSVNLDQHHNEYEVGRSLRLSYIHNVGLRWI